MQDFTDPDLLAMGVRPNRGFPFARVLLVITLLGAGVFVGAAYLPLRKAQQQLASKYETLAKDASTVKEELKKKQEELQRIDAEREKLAATVAASDEQNKGRSDQLSDVQQKLEAALAKRIEQKLATITVGDGAVVVSIPRRVMYSPNSLKIMRAGSQLRCEIGRAITPGESKVSLTAYSGSDEVPPELAKDYASIWELSAAEAALAAASLTGQCKFSSSRVTAVARAATAGLATGEPDANALIEVEVRP
jgi:flagellar motor protein MotB